MKIFASRFAALIALSALAAPAVHAATVPDGGLLVTRVNSEQWEITLVGGSAPKQFTGSITSSVPFYSSSGVNIESTDLFTQTSTSNLGMTLNVAAGRQDVVRFSVALDARLCLRGSGAPVFVGESFDDATAVSAPVALHGADACGSSMTTATATALTTSTSTAALTTTTTTRKFNKGHYIALMSYDDSTKMMAASMKPGVKGFLKRYDWRELEPSQGNYNFSEIQSDLIWCAANGMQLVVMIEDKSFRGGTNPAPVYLANYAVPNTGGGLTMLRWHPTVVTRFKALVTALGAKFDSNRAFEGIATQETAPSLSSTALNANGYTPEKYRDAYISILTAAGTAMPTSRVFWYMNFMPGNNSGSYLGSIAAAVASKGVVMGCPDVAPDSTALQTRTYPLFDQFKGKMPMFGQVEGLVYEHLHTTSGYSTKYWTMTEIYNFAKTEMHANYMFWVRIPVASPADSNDYYDALPVIATYPTIN
jgi:hypothetical protein